MLQGLGLKNPGDDPGDFGILPVALKTPGVFGVLN